VASIDYTFAESLDLVRVAHKYCMESFERPAIKRLQLASSIQEYVELVVVSQPISLDELYKQAVDGLAQNWHRILSSHAQRIGVDALFDVGKRFTTMCFNCRELNAQLECGACGRVR
jgi:hypothetical protein